ncbi:la-related protein 6 [Nilaparvata lugens]|uniref:la-related protein 6 n=1 Tax=Nilaparvata lugens TaxID=108931 RepID=UPI00193DFDF4|nr:la-related protein 6 [Nilaparvata lugens]
MPEQPEQQQEQQQQDKSAEEKCSRPPMKHSDTKDSISSVESDGGADNQAHLADLSDTASESDGKEVPPPAPSPVETVVSAAPAPPKSTASKDDDDDEEDEAPFVPPDDELVEKIIAQVEFYFSDVNITKDAFLLKHVKRNKEGYVSLKLISSFKRVKHIAKDWRAVAYALRKSKKLQVNEAGTKLRRVDPLPAYDQTAPSRTVVAIALPLEKPTVENVAEMFRECGEIALVRILRPGNPIPADVRHFVNKHPEMNGTISALVEFVRTESAHNAINRCDYDRGMRVLELNAPPSKKKSVSSKKSPVSRLVEPEYSSSCPSGSEVDDHRFRMGRRCSSPHLVRDHWTQRRWSRDSGSESTGSSYSRSRSNSGVYYMTEHGVRRMSTGWDSGSDGYMSNRSRSNSTVSRECCCCGGRRGSFGKDSGSEGYGSARSRCDSGASDVRRKDSGELFCPAPRRFSLSKDAEPFRPRSGSNSEPMRRISGSYEPGLMRQRSSGGIVVPENILRMPRGPDGGRGFIVPAPACHTLVE